MCYKRLKKYMVTSIYVIVNVPPKSKHKDKPYMNTITQTTRFRQALVEYSLKHDVTKAAIRCKTNRQCVYRRCKRYDGTIHSLADKSHRPHSHPNQHTPDELKLISDMHRRNPHAGLVVFWVKHRQRG